MDRFLQDALPAFFCSIRVGNGVPIGHGFWGSAMYKQLSFTREELYQMVWARPVLLIAKDIGISDVALSKACRRAGIPLPQRRHWAVLKSGRKIKTPALPSRKAAQPEVVQFSVLENPPPPRPPKASRPAIPSIDVPAALVKPHPLIVELKAAADRAEEDKGVLVLDYQKVLRLRVSSLHLPRALILLDTLIKQLALRGYKIEIGGAHKETELILNEGQLSFRLDERTTQQTPLPPPRLPGKARNHDAYYSPWQPAYVLVATGEFVLQFGVYALRNVRRTWKDKAGRPLESQLHEVFEAIPSWEASLKARRLEDEERRERFHREEEYRAAVARRREVLRRQRAGLFNNLQAWERSARLLQFIAAVEATGDDSEQTLQWVAWAKEQARLIDPIQGDLSALTNLAVKIEGHFQAPSSWEKIPQDWWN